MKHAIAKLAEANSERITMRLASVSAAVALDEIFSEPPTKLHPVAWFGSAMREVEQRLYKDTKTSGVLYCAIGVSLGAAFGKLAKSTVAVTAIAIAGKQLRTVAKEVQNANDIDQARAELRSLVGRETGSLTRSEISAAVIESVAENSVDAIIAPIFWALIGGGSAVGAYRAINTMDAMVGHRSQRYKNFGWASARLDDHANWIPARIFALLVILIRPKAVTDIVTTVVRDGTRHPSPNSGIAEAAVAAATQVTLGGTLRYGNRVEERPKLGNGKTPRPSDIDKAIAISKETEFLLAAACAITAFIRYRHSAITTFIRYHRTAN